jgi:hypothetical protein
VSHLIAEFPHAVRGALTSAAFSRRTSPHVRINGSYTTATLMARLKQDRADKS